MAQRSRRFHERKLRSALLDSMQCLMPCMQLLEYTV